MKRFSKKISPPDINDNYNSCHYWFLQNEEVNHPGSLKSYSDNFLSDKNTWHTYLDVYEKLFEPIKHTATHIFEIGISRGGSIKMWHKYFQNAEIHASDITLHNVVVDLSDSRFKIYETNAYSESFVNTFKVETFDVIIDDGPHTLDSMIHFSQLYPKLLKLHGLLVIEDIQSIDWIPEIVKHLPTHMIPNVEVFDMRHINGRYDNIMIVCRNSKNSLSD